MKTFHLDTDISISVKNMQSNSSDLHKHHYFELIYIMDGAGVHNINGNHFKFQKGDAFLLTPEDAHTFIITNPVKCCILDFTESFFRKKGTFQDTTDLFKKLEYVFHNHNLVKGNLLSNENNNLIETLISQLLIERESLSISSKEIIQNIVFLLILFVSRNIQALSVPLGTNNKVSTGYQIINYLQQNIYNNKALGLK